MSNKANMGESFRESVESVSKDIRYRKALVEKFYFNNHGNYIAYYGYETVLHVKMTLFILSSIWIGYMIGLFLHYTWKDSSEWSYIETWAIYYVLFRFGYVYGYNTEKWLRRVELGNYDKAILNEPGSSKENPIDLTVEEAEAEAEAESTATAEAEATQTATADDEGAGETVDDEAESTQNVSGVESVEI